MHACACMSVCVLRPHPPQTCFSIDTAKETHLVAKHGKDL